MFQLINYLCSTIWTCLWNTFWWKSSSYQNACKAIKKGKFSSERNSWDEDRCSSNQGKWVNQKVNQFTTGTRHLCNNKSTTHVGIESPKQSINGKFKNCSFFAFIWEISKGSYPLMKKKHRTSDSRILFLEKAAQREHKQNPKRNDTMGRKASEKGRSFPV